MSTTAVGSPSKATSSGRSIFRAGDSTAAPVLDAPDSRPAQALSALVGPTHPVRTFLAGVALAYVVIAGFSILLGLLVTRVLIANHQIAAGDESLVRVLSHHRASDFTEGSRIGSIVAGGVALPILVGVVALVAAAFRQWRIAAFVIFALAVESAAYRTTTLIVHRHRPDVHRLEQLPVNASYPSGHTAASIAVYSGLALLLTSRMAAGKLPRFAVWAFAAAITLFVALSRMYRGMHHPLDVLGGVAIGVATLGALVVCCRAAGVAVDNRNRVEAEP
jgi:membrane-associated phospholipid phosphatase